MASNLLAMASTLVAMASTLLLPIKHKVHLSMLGIRLQCARRTHSNSRTPDCKRAHSEANDT